MKQTADFVLVSVKKNRDLSGIFLEKWHNDK